MDRRLRGRRDIFSAALDDDADLLRELLEGSVFPTKGSDAGKRCLIVDDRNDSGLTALHIAATEGSLRCAHLLLEFGADVNARDIENGWTPLCRALYAGHFGVALFLLSETSAVEFLSEGSADPGLIRRTAVFKRDVSRWSSKWLSSVSASAGINRGGGASSSSSHFFNLRRLIHPGPVDKEGFSPLDLFARTRLSPLLTAVRKSHGVVIPSLLAPFLNETSSGAEPRLATASELTHAAGGLGPKARASKRGKHDNTRKGKGKGKRRAASFEGGSGSDSEADEDWELLKSFEAEGLLSPEEDAKDASAIEAAAPLAKAMAPSASAPLLSGNVVLRPCQTIGDVAYDDGPSAQSRSSVMPVEDGPVWKTQVLAFGLATQYALGFATASGQKQALPRAIDLEAAQEYSDLTSSLPVHVASVHASRAMSAFLLASGELLVAGESRRLGLPGDTSSSGVAVLPILHPSFGPRSLSTRIPIVALSLGSRHALAVCAEGGCYSWGDNHSGQCGFNPFSSPSAARRSSTATDSDDSEVEENGVPASSKASPKGKQGAVAKPLLPPITLGVVSAPRRIEGALKRMTVARVAAGGHHSLLSCTDGSVWSFGSNLLGQLGQKDIPCLLSLGAADRSGGCTGGGGGHFPTEEHRHLCSSWLPRTADRLPFSASSLSPYAGSSSTAKATHRLLAAMSSGAASGEDSSRDRPGPSVLEARYRGHVLDPEDDGIGAAETRRARRRARAATVQGTGSSLVGAPPLSGADGFGRGVFTPSGGTNAGRKKDDAKDKHAFFSPRGDTASLPHDMPVALAATDGYSLVLSSSGEVVIAGLGSPLWARLPFDLSMAAVKEGIQSHVDAKASLAAALSASGVTSSAPSFLSANSVSATNAQAGDAAADLAKTGFSAFAWSLSKKKGGEDDSDEGLGPWGLDQEQERGGWQVAKGAGAASNSAPSSASSLVPSASSAASVAASGPSARIVAMSCARHHALFCDEDGGLWGFADPAKRELIGLPQEGSQPARGAEGKKKDGQRASAVPLQDDVLTLLARLEVGKPAALWLWGKPERNPHLSRAGVNVVKAAASLHASYALSAPSCSSGFGSSGGEVFAFGDSVAADQGLLGPLNTYSNYGGVATDGEGNGTPSAASSVLSSSLGSTSDSTGGGSPSSASTQESSPPSWLPRRLPTLRACIDVAASESHVIVTTFTVRPPLPPLRPHPSDVAAVHQWYGQSSSSVSRSTSTFSLSPTATSRASTAVALRSSLAIISSSHRTHEDETDRFEEGETLSGPLEAPLPSTIVIDPSLQPPCFSNEAGSDKRRAAEAFSKLVYGPLSSPSVPQLQPREVYYECLKDTLAEGQRQWQQGIAAAASTSAPLLTPDCGEGPVCDLLPSAQNMSRRETLYFVPSLSSLAERALASSITSASEAAGFLASAEEQGAEGLATFCGSWLFQNLPSLLATAFPPLASAKAKSSGASPSSRGQSKTDATSASKAPGALFNPCLLQRYREAFQAGSSSGAGPTTSGSLAVSRSTSGSPDWTSLLLSSPFVLGSLQRGKWIDPRRVALDRHLCWAAHQALVRSSKLLQRYEQELLRPTATYRGQRHRRDLATGLSAAAQEEMRNQQAALITSIASSLPQSQTSIVAFDVARTRSNLFPSESVVQRAIDAARALVDPSVVRDSGEADQRTAESVSGAPATVLLTPTFSSAFDALKEFKRSIVSRAQNDRSSSLDWFLRLQQPAERASALPPQGGNAPLALRVCLSSCPALLPSTLFSLLAVAGPSGTLPSFSPLQSALDRLAANLFELGGKILKPSPQAVASPSSTVGPSLAESRASLLACMPDCVSSLSHVQGVVPNGAAGSEHVLVVPLSVAARLLTSSMAADVSLLLRRTKALRRKLIAALTSAVAVVSFLPASQKDVSSAILSLLSEGGSDASNIIRGSRRFVFLAELWSLFPFIAASSSLASFLLASLAPGDAGVAKDRLVQLHADAQQALSFFRELESNGLTLATPARPSVAAASMDKAADTATRLLLQHQDPPSAAPSSETAGATENEDAFLLAVASRRPDLLRPWLAVALSEVLHTAARGESLNGHLLAKAAPATPASVLPAPSSNKLKQPLSVTASAALPSEPPHPPTAGSGRVMATQVERKPQAVAVAPKASPLLGSEAARPLPLGSSAVKAKTTAASTAPSVATAFPALGATPPPRPTVPPVPRPLAASAPLAAAASPGPVAPLAPKPAPAPLSMKELLALDEKQSQLRRQQQEREDAKKRAALEQQTRMASSGLAGSAAKSWGASAPPAMAPLPFVPAPSSGGGLLADIQREQAQAAEALRRAQAEREAKHKSMGLAASSSLAPSAATTSAVGKTWGLQAAQKSSASLLGPSLADIEREERDKALARELAAREKREAAERLSAQKAQAKAAFERALEESKQRAAATAPAPVPESASPSEAGASAGIDKKKGKKK